MAKENKKEWDIVDRLISLNNLSDSTKKEVRKIAKEYHVHPFKAFRMVINPRYLLEAAFSKMSPKEQRRVAKGFGGIDEKR